MIAFIALQFRGGKTSKKALLGLLHEFGDGPHKRNNRQNLPRSLVWIRSYLRIPSRFGNSPVSAAKNRLTFEPDADSRCPGNRSQAGCIPRLAFVAKTHRLRRICGSVGSLTCYQAAIRLNVGSVQKLHPAGRCIAPDIRHELTTRATPLAAARNL